MYNPWSILNYADMKVLDNYWINTSSNYLVKKALKEADSQFWERNSGMAYIGNLLYGKKQQSQFMGIAG